MSFSEADVRRASDGTFTTKNGSAPEVNIFDTPKGEEAAVISALAVLRAWQPDDESSFKVHEPVAPGRDWFVEFYEPDGSVKFSMDLGPEGVPTRIFKDGKPLDSGHTVASLAEEAVLDALKLDRPNYGQRKRAERFNFEGRALYTYEGAADLMDEAGEYMSRASTLRDVDAQHSAYLNSQYAADPGLQATPGSPEWKTAMDRRELAMRAATWQAVRRSRELRFAGEREEYSRLPDRNEFRRCGSKTEVAALLEELNDDQDNIPSYQRSMRLSDAVERSLELEK